MEKFRCPKCKSEATEVLGTCISYVLLDCTGCLTVSTLRKHAVTKEVEPQYMVT